MSHQAQPVPAYFVEVPATGRLRAEIIRLQSEGFALPEFKDMECRNRAGAYIRCDLRKVTPGVRDKLVRLARTVGEAITLYRAEGTDLPRDYLSLVFTQADPFAESRRARAAARRRLARSATHRPV